MSPAYCLAANGIMSLPSFFAPVSRCYCIYCLSSGALVFSVSLLAEHAVGVRLLGGRRLGVRVVCYLHCTPHIPAYSMYVFYHVCVLVGTGASLAPERW